MPATHFRVVWPDGTRQRCFSPSLVAQDVLGVGKSYSLAEFVGRADRALQLGSKRVRERFAVECSMSAKQHALINRGAIEFVADEHTEVLVEGFEP